jgi:hypothetical protein
MKWDEMAVAGLASACELKKGQNVCSSTETGTGCGLVQFGLVWFGLVWWVNLRLGLIVYMDTVIDWMLLAPAHFYGVVRPRTVT